MQHYSIWRVTFLTTGISIYDIRNDCDYSRHTYTEKRRSIMGAKAIYTTESTTLVK